MTAIHTKSAAHRGLNDFAAYRARRSWLADVEEAAWLHESHEVVGRCLCCALPLDADSDDICVDCLETSSLDDDWSGWVDLGAPD